MTAHLLATLGSEPQVIALALQLLQQSHHVPDRVTVLHTDARQPPLDRALPALQAAWTAHPDWPPLHRCVVPCRDVLAQAEMEQFAATLFAALQEALAAGARIHLLLAGGRKSMALIGMAVAQLLLGPADHVWYLHSDESLRTSGRFDLLPGDQAELIPIPLPAMGLAPPRWTHVFLARTPDAARQALADRHMQEAQHFVAHELTPAEREVAGLVATTVLTTAQIAARLHKSPKTVSNQLNSVYSKLEAAFGLQPDIGVKREFLRQTLRPYFSQAHPQI